MSSTPAQPVADDPARRMQRWIGVAQVLVTLAVFAGVARKDFVNYDVPAFITRNPLNCDSPASTTELAAPFPSFMRTRHAGELA